MAGIADKFDKAYEDKSLTELADAPVAAAVAGTPRSRASSSGSGSPGRSRPTRR